MSIALLILSGTEIFVNFFAPKSLHVPKQQEVLLCNQKLFGISDYSPAGDLADIADNLKLLIAKFNV
jgi:hypothetical protein